jgi:hypothetical protein
MKIHVSLCSLTIIVLLNRLLSVPERNSLYNHADGVLCDVGAEAMETIDRDRL